MATILGQYHNLKAAASQREVGVVFTTAGASAPTVVDQLGVISVARVGTGSFTVTLPNGVIHANVQVTAEFTTTAQVPLITARTFANGFLTSVTINTVTAGSGIAVDTTGMTLHVVVHARVAN
jgi:hypothetical protein